MMETSSILTCLNCGTSFITSTGYLIPEKYKVFGGNLNMTCTKACYIKSLESTKGFYHKSLHKLNAVLMRIKKDGS